MRWSFGQWPRFGHSPNLSDESYDAFTRESFFDMVDRGRGRAARLARWSRSGHLVGVSSATLVACFAITAVWRAPGQSGVDPLPSWNEGVAKSTIRAFVARVTTEGEAGYVPPTDRIAVFDDDGTLWCEQPVYVEAAFAYARVARLLQRQPVLAARQPYKAIIERDSRALAAMGEKSVAEIIASTHSGISTTDFDSIVVHWLNSARHPRFGTRYNELAYQPMLDLLAYLRANGFKTYVVAAGGVDFTRAWAPAVYGIPREQIIGSSVRLAFELRDGKPRLRRLPTLDFLDDGSGKPVGIYRVIAQRPILAFGNSDADLPMLQYTDDGARPRLLLLLRHDDAEREYSYDRVSKIGRLDKALDDARVHGWTVVSMKNDWATVFAPR